MGKRETSEELERRTKIEKRIMRLLEVAKGDERSKIIINDSKSKQLICGTI